MDRDRLKEVHQTDLTEGRVNEDFVHWLKTSGPGYLLVFLLVIAAWLFWGQWKDRTAGRVDQAWSQLASSRLPGAMEELANEYEDLKGLSSLALLQGADLCLSSVISNTEIGQDTTNSGAPPEPLPAEKRIQYLEQAADLYQRVVELDDQSPGMTLSVVNAMNGLAAVSETQGDLEMARQWYERAASRAEATYPLVASAAREQIETLDVEAAEFVLPASAELPTTTADTLRQAILDPALRKLIQTDDLEDDGGSTQTP